MLVICVLKSSLSIITIINLLHHSTIFIISFPFLNIKYHWQVYLGLYIYMSLPGGSVVMNPTCQSRRWRFNPWVGNISRKRKWQPTSDLQENTMDRELQSMGLKIIRHDWATECTHTHTHTHTYTSLHLSVFLSNIYFCGNGKSGHSDP